MNLYPLIEKIFKPPSPSYNYQAKFVKRWLNSLEKKGYVLLNIGSGQKRFVPHIINLDIRFLSEVDIVADSEFLPIKSEIIDGIICSALLEHVVNPEKVIQEIYRCLKPNSQVYFEVPFLQAGHMMALGDYRRFTLQGIESLLRRFKRQDSGVCIGPFSVIAWSFRKMPTIFIRSDFLNKGIELFFGWLTFWIKYFDVFCKRLPNLEVFNGGVFFLGIKNTPQNKNSFT